jgi:hypothetical protein
MIYNSNQQHTIMEAQTRFIGAVVVGGGRGGVGALTSR